MQWVVEQSKMKEPAIKFWLFALIAAGKYTEIYYY